MAAILAKIGPLVLRTLAQPLSNYFTAYVMGNPEARKHAITAAQVIRYTEELRCLKTSCKTYV
jgi:hypothetical protein